MIVDKRLNNLADAYCRANNREFKYLWLKKIMEYMRKIDNKRNITRGNWMIEIFVDAPIELQVLILFGVVMIVKELWTWE